MIDDLARPYTELALQAVAHGYSRWFALDRKAKLPSRSAFSFFWHSCEEQKLWRALLFRNHRTLHQMANTDGAPSAPIRTGRLALVVALSGRPNIVGEEENYE
jgi:hypothetical protein